jgi:hypothetical protein
MGVPDLVPDIGVIRSLFHEASQQGSRSTVLTDLRWMLGILGAVLLGLVTYHAPPWLLISASVATGLCVFVFLAAYVYFCLANPEFLRSEKFALSKMAIEHSLKGDSDSGYKMTPVIDGQAITGLPSGTEALPDSIDDETGH